MPTAVRSAVCMCAVILGAGVPAGIARAQASRHQHCAPSALALVQQAGALRARASARDQAFIDALAQRYSGNREDRASRDRDYAAAMLDVIRRFPDDRDAAALHAEAVTDLRPWGYWMPEGTSHEGTAEIVARLETARPFDRLAPLPTPAGAGSMAPQLAAAPDGRLYLSWLEPAGGKAMRMRVAERRAGTWDLRADVVEGTDLFANWADVPSIFAAKDGRLAAHWLQKTASSPDAYGIRVRSSQDGGRTWSPVAVPHRDDSPTEHGFLSFFDAPGEQVGMVWLDGRATATQAAAGGGHGHGGGDGAMTLRATSLAGDGTMGADVLVDDRVCDCCPTTAVATSRGAIVAYRDRSDREVRDISVARLVNGRWQAGGSVHPDGWEIPGCPVNGPALASSGDTLALAWFTAANDQGRVQLAFSRDGGSTFGAPVRIDDGEALGRVDVELLPDGSAVALWIERREGTSELRARRVFGDGRRGPSAVVAQVSADRSGGHPRVVRSGHELVFAWREIGATPRVVAAVAAVPADAAK